MIGICIHPLAIKSKSQALDNIGKITNEIPHYWKTYPIDTVIEKICNGHTWCGAKFDSCIKKAKNWEEQQVFAIDVDNEYGELITPEDLYQHYLKKEFPPNFSYFSLSSSEDKPKFRLVWVLQNPVVDPEIAKNFKRWLILNSKGKADSCTINLDRLYFGGVKDCIWNNSPIICDNLPQIEKKRPKNNTPQIKSEKVENSYKLFLAYAQVIKAMADPFSSPWGTRYKTIFNGAVYLIKESNGCLTPEVLLNFFETQMSKTPEYWANYHYDLDDIAGWLDSAYAWTLDNVLINETTT